MSQEYQVGELTQLRAMLEQQQSEMNLLREKLASQEAELAQQKAKVARLETEQPTLKLLNTSEVSPTSRRRMLKKLAASAATAAVAATALSLNDPQTAGAIGVLGTASDPFGVSGAPGAIPNPIAADLPPANSGVKIGVIGVGESLIPLAIGFTPSIGVYGGSKNGVGLYGYSNSNAAVFGNSDNGYGGYFDGALAPMRLNPSASVVGSPPTGNHSAGEFFVDKNGVLYYCTVKSTLGNPGTWQQIAPTPAVAGSVWTITYLNNPIRILGPYSTTYPDFPPFNPKSVQYFPIVGPQINNPPDGNISATIPSDAKAITGSISAFGNTKTGFLTVFPADATKPVVATLLYSPGGLAITGFTTKLGMIPAGPNAGKIGIAIYSEEFCQIALDIVSYQTGAA